ncbi:MAG: DUF58 domain-containing protein [Chloroflexota bacterium]
MSDLQPASTPVSSHTAGSAERILQRIEWQVLRRLDGQLQGDYRSLFYGYGADFADLREYQPGDDIRYIDWNVTARTDQPYVRQYTEDREISAWFLLDLSPSMAFGTDSAGKHARLVELTGLLARLLTRHGNRVAALLYGGRAPAADGEQPLQHIPPGSGRRQVLWLMDALLKPPAAPPGLTDLAPLLETGLRAIRRRSLVFVISDFLCAPGWERPLRLLSRRHEVLAVRLWDPAEAELPDVGAAWLEDAETGEQLYVDTGDARFRARYAEAARQRQADLERALRHAGAVPWSLSAGEGLLRAVLRFAELRRRPRR